MLISDTWTKPGEVSKGKGKVKTNPQLLVDRIYGCEQEEERKKRTIMSDTKFKQVNNLNIWEVFKNRTENITLKSQYELEQRKCLLKPKENIKKQEDFIINKENCTKFLCKISQGMLDNYYTD